LATELQIQLQRLASRQDRLTGWQAGWLAGCLVTVTRFQAADLRDHIGRDAAGGGGNLPGTPRPSKGSSLRTVAPPSSPYHPSTLRSNGSRPRYSARPLPSSCAKVRLTVTGFAAFTGRHPLKAYGCSFVIRKIIIGGILCNFIFLTVCGPPSQS
jgi:hypothetical protein